MELRAARAAFERVGAMHLAERAATACGDVRADNGSVSQVAGPSPLSKAEPRTVTTGSQPNVFRREGDYWCVTFDGHTARVRDAKGLHYLACLLAAPERAIHVLDLIAADRGEPTPGPRDAGSSEPLLSGDAGEMLDATAKAAYRRRLAEIDEDIEDARAAGDQEREAQADAEREFLTRELSRAVGLGGRDRRAGSAAERARVSVTRAVRAALGRVREHHPTLGAHLDRAIRTGVYCAYVPEARAAVEWER